MKQCPGCKRTYTDETLHYCLEDGSLLISAYDSEATRVMPFPRATDPPQPQVSPSYPPPIYPPPPQRSKWPLYVLILLLLLFVGGGAVTLLIIGLSQWQDQSSARFNQRRSEGAPSTNSPSPANSSQSLLSPDSSPQSSPSTSPTPQSRQLVGIWRTNVYENNERMEITYTFFPDGTSKAVFKDSAGQTTTHLGTWQFSDSTLFETFPSGASGKGTIRWIDQDNFEITIIDNGVPLYSGLKRRYRRVSDSSSD